MDDRAIPIRARAQAQHEPLEKTCKFLDLPVEVRNKIYEELLCSFYVVERNDADYGFEQTSDFTIARPSIHPEILRVNRSIHDEAAAVMRIKNQFVFVDDCPRVLDPYLISCELPLLQFNVGRNFKGVVLSHKISEREISEESHGRLFLLRDLAKFIKVLELLASRVQSHEMLFEHNIHVEDPWQDMPKPDHVDSFKESLIAPYRSLRGFKHFKITGIPKRLANAILKDITRPPVMKQPENILAEVEEIKRKGNEAWRNKDISYANNFWVEAINMIHASVNGNSGAHLRKASSASIIHSFITLEFTLYSNIVQARLEKLRALRADGAPHYITDDLGHRFFGLLRAAKTVRIRWLDDFGRSWEATPTQMAKLMYREAVACRILGWCDLLERAEFAIATALKDLPGDPALLEEQNRIKKWRERINGRGRA